jgi:hypothetical protein
MSDLDVKSAWITRVLGISLTQGSTPDTVSQKTETGGKFDWPTARAAFDQAIADIDKQISALQAALKSSDDDVLEEIAEFGMNGITGNHRVKLMAAMMEMGGGDPAVVKQSAQKLIKLAEEFKTFLEGDERVEVCDENPFGVPVSIRATLGGALGNLAAELRKA